MESKSEITVEIKRETDPIYQKVSKVIPEIEWAFHAPLIHKINMLKKEKNTVVLAHNYQTPEIFHCIADIAADSLALAVEAEKTSADIIVLCGVHFMAETAKLMNPKKKILLPDMEAGCYLASSITGKDVKMLKEKYPSVPVVTYVNTSAEVKAESDTCCTSANAVRVVESLGVDKVVFLPDQYMAKYVQTKTKVQIISWIGTCIVHERFSAQEIEDIKKQNPEIVVLSHPECPPEVIAASDFTGSTSGMSQYVKKNQPSKVMLVTECSMSDNVQVDNPNVQFIKPCNLCPHMKTISLQKVLECLEKETNEILIPEIIIKKAQRAVERMIAVGRSH